MLNLIPWWKKVERSEHLETRQRFSTNKFNCTNNESLSDEVMEKFFSMRFQTDEQGIKILCSSSI